MKLSAILTRLFCLHCYCTLDLTTDKKCAREGEYTAWVCCGCGKRKWYITGMN